MFGERLKLARKKSGLSLRDLSDKLKGVVSAQAISKYERGLMLPSSDILMKLCEVLNVSYGYFMSPMNLKVSNIEYRKYSNTKAKELANVEAQVIELAEKYLTIEKIINVPSANKWQDSLRKISSIDEAESLAQQCREKWGLGYDPIPNMTELLEELGMKVLMVESDRVSGLTAMLEYGDSAEKVPVVVVNKNHTLERRRLTLAHELGHRLICSSSSVDEEKAANRFAAAFLIPKQHVENEIGKHRTAISFPELFDLKRFYRVSAGALVYRLKELGIINEITTRNFFILYSQRWKKTEEPMPLENEQERGESEKPKRFERLCYWALSEDFISLSKASELLGISIQDVENMMKNPEMGCEKWNL